jgi:hypothetical protein
MQKKRYWLALMPLAAVWVYAVARSGGELFSLFSPEAAQAVLTVEAPSEPLVAPLAVQRGDEAPAAEPPAIAAAEPPAPAPRRASPPPAEPPPAAHPDAGYDAAAAGTEPVDHPEVTDPHLRKLLQPAWDD